MKHCFKPKKFGPDAQHLINIMDAIITEYDGKGFRLTLRQLYYQLVSRDVIANTVQEYKRIGGIVSDARRSGDMDIDVIEDRGRETAHPNTWDSPAQIIDSAAATYRLNPWDTQIVHVEVMIEKDALSGIIQPACMGERVPFMANKGYISTSFGYQIGQRLKRIHEGSSTMPGKDIHIIYLGDHDPSGIQMTEDILERITMFAGGIPIQVHRIALNMDQVRHYKPPENPAKETDSRYKAYVEKFDTESSWELDALSPEVLTGLVRQKIRSLRDDALWAESIALEEKQRRMLATVAEKFREKFGR